jgi:hypothetical protein
VIFLIICEAGEMSIMQILEMIFSGLMVAGAVGSLIANVIEKGPFSVYLQLIGAALLYMGLLMRDI